MMRQDFRNFALSHSLPRWLPAILLLAAALFVGPVRADVVPPCEEQTCLRVEARPIGDPIQAFITVTDSNGDPVGVVLDASDFVVKLDTVTLAIQPSDLTQPPAQDPNQRVSVVFVMDYSPSITNIAQPAMEAAVTDFINAMNIGDYAAIIKFNGANGAIVVWPFTQIDGAAGTNDLVAAVAAAFPVGSGTPLLDALDLGIDQFTAPASPLPAGPKAVIVITDGGETDSTATKSDVIANANDNSIPIFTIGVGDIIGEGGLELLTKLPDKTGGLYTPAPSDAEIAAAYVTVSKLLNNEFLLTIPSGITDCFLHTLQITVAGQPVPPGSATFSRRDCDTTPNPFSFTNQTGVKPNRSVTSNTVTISGVEGPVTISVTTGKYSVGCGADVTFTSSDGTISSGETVCVRHTSDVAYSTAKATTLTVGTASATFTSTTSAEPPPNRGGGGAMGIVELLAGLVALAARRRRAFKC
jgi:Mg-chelatase subunit ChlD